MKKNLWTLLVLLCSFTASAQQVVVVRGKIRDATNNEPLTGASVKATESDAYAVSDLQGEFLINLPSGASHLYLRYLGYQDTTIQVNPVQLAGKQLIISMRSSSLQLNALTINGTVQGQAKALNQQKSADNIMNIVSADQIGRFPDPNAAEALQRVPGVNIERDQGEGRYVFVRGLAPQFTNVRVNGEQIPSPEASVRYVALDAIPSDQLSSLEITKSLTPDMDGDAIGGSINLITRTAQSSRPEVSASLIGGYNNLMQRGNMQGSLQWGQRFGNNEKLGILLNGSYYTNNLGSDNWERSVEDNEFELRDYELTRTRTGLSSTFDYKFDQHQEIYLKTLYSRFTDREWRRRYIFIPDDGEVERQGKDRFEAQSISSFNFGGRHIFPAVQVEYDLQYAYANQNTPYDHQASFVAELDNSVDFSNPDFPELSAPGYLDNSLYEFDELEVGHTLAQDQTLTASLNVGLPYGSGRHNGLFKTGGKIRLKNKEFEITQNKFENLGGVPDLDQFAGGLLDENFLGNRYQLSPGIELNRLIGYFNENPARFEPQLEDKSIDEALEAYDAREDVYAAYAMVRQDLGKLMVLGGLRYEHTEVSYHSYDVVIAPNGDLQEVVSVKGNSSYSFWLPQFHLKYDLSRNTILRGAATYSYARPNFSEIIPAQEANLEEREANVGNADLKPVGAFNVDVTAERYFRNVGILSGGYFYKRLNDFIYPKVIFNAAYPLGAATPTATGIDITQAQNGESAHLHGVEVALQRKLDFLPGALSGLGVYLNYTYTNSKAFIQSRDAGEGTADKTEEINLPGQTAHMGNASLAYEYKGFAARLALNFNGEYLSEVGASADEDTYVNNRMQLDATGSYAISSSIRFFAEFLNLTNQPFEVYQGNADTKIQREFYGWWSRIGIKFDIQ